VTLSSVLPLGIAVQAPLASSTVSLGPTTLASIDLKEGAPVILEADAKSNNACTNVTAGSDNGKQQQNTVYTNSENDNPQ